MVLINVCFVKVVLQFFKDFCYNLGSAEIGFLIETNIICLIT